jgi:hypothetical protein
MDDPRIRYINTRRRVAMSANWEFALSHVGDAWLGFVGDDDGLIPGALRKVAQIIETTQVEALRARCAKFDWPSVNQKRHGRLIVPLHKGLEVRNSQHWLRKTLSGIAKYPELPVIYNGGFAHKRVFERIKARAGSYFGSSSPDVYSAVAIASVTSNYAYCREALAIDGTSRHSTGNSFFSNKQSNNTSPADAFLNEGNIPFHSDMLLSAEQAFPRSFHALTYEAYLQAGCLRDSAERESPGRQLQIIMGGDTRHRSAVYEWGKVYAHHHGLDYARCRRGAFLRGLVLRPHALAVKVLRAANSLVIDDPRVPITDVYQASIAISVAQARKYRWQSLPYFLRERFSRSG